MLGIHLLGWPRVVLDSTPVPIAGRPKVVPLLAYLLLNRHTLLRRDSIAAALWPDEDDADARANLRRHLHYLQTLLPPSPHDAPWIASTASTVRWNLAAPFWLDIAEFEKLSIVAGAEAQAAELYGGDLLEQIDEPWLLYERERLRTAYLGCLMALSGRQRAQRRYLEAIATVQKLLASDPWREDAIRQLIAIRYESGDRSGALRDYETFAATLRDQLGVAPMSETTAAYRAIVAGIPPAGIVLGVPAGAALPAPEAAGERTPRAAQAELPLLGREVELASLRARWGRATEGIAQAIFISGEAGIGKTRLVRELAADCERQGGQLFAGATTSPEPAPYQAVAALLRTALPMAADVSIEPIWFAALEPLLPMLREIVARVPALPPVNPAQERTRLFEACVAVVEGLCRHRATCLVLEDLHWAGAATLELCEHLVRRLGAARLLIVVTYREDDLERNHPLRGVRRRLEAEGRAAHLALRPLSPETLATFVGSHAELGEREKRDVTRLLQTSGEGNPFFLSEIVRDLIETGALTITGGRWTQYAPASADLTEAAAPPVGIRLGLEARLGRLSARARAVADVAAIAGRSFSVELLTEVSGWREAEVADALGELVDRHLVEDAPPGDFAFRHQLVQSTLYATIEDGQRSRRHRRIAQVIEELRPGHGELAAELALHWDRGGEPERAAGQYLTAARHAFALYAGEEAQRHVQRALEIGSALRLRFDSLALAERVAALRGDRVAQSGYLADLALLAPELGDEESSLVLLARRIELANLTGNRVDEADLIERMEQRARDTDNPRWQAAALESRARMYRSTGDFKAARAAFEGLMELTGDSADRSTYVNAFLARADTLIYEGRLEEARGALEEIRSFAALDRSALVRTLIAFSRAALAQQDYAAMTGHAQQAYEISRAIGDREGEALAQHTIANGLVYTFHVAQARAAYEQAMDIYAALDHPVGQASIAVDYGLFNAELGFLARGLELFARADAIASPIGFQWVRCVSAVNAGYAYRLAADPLSAKAAGLRALELARALNSQQLESAALGTLGAAERELGELDASLAHLHLGVALRRPAGQTPRLGDNLCALALTLLDCGDLAAAHATADELLALYEANPKLAPQPTEWLWAAARVYGSAGEAQRRDALVRQAALVMQARVGAIDSAAGREAFLALPFNREVAEALRTIR